MGSLIAALASFLDARHNAGDWLVRIEDLDPPREDPTAAATILHSLKCHGLHWDEDVLYQSTRASAYGAALTELAQAGHVFRCDCSRAKLLADGRCQGNCRARQAQIQAPFALRVAVKPDCKIHFVDLLQGPQHSALGASLADFVVQRKDGLDAYQLAVVVDDAAQGITHVVRGSDLLDSTARQIYLQQLLGYTTPQYCHLPVITNTEGQKLSKQNQAPALVNDDAPNNLRSALRFLRQQEPSSSLARVEPILAHAIEHWKVKQTPATMSAAASTIGLSL